MKIFSSIGIGSLMALILMRPMKSLAEVTRFNLYAVHSFPFKKTYCQAKVSPRVNFYHVGDVGLGRSNQRNFK